MTKNELKKYIEQNEFDIQNGSVVYLAASACFDSFTNCDVFKGMVFSPNIGYYEPAKNGSFYEIVGKAILNKFGKKLYQLFRKNKKSFYKIKNDHKKSVQEIDKYWLDYLRAKEKVLSRQETARYLRGLFRVADKWWRISPIIEDKAIMVEKKVIPIFAKKYDISEEGAREIVSLLAHPNEIAIFNRERIVLLKIVLLIKNNYQYFNLLKKREYNKLYSKLSLQKTINNYIRDYFWIDTNFSKAVEMTPEYLLAKINKEFGKLTTQKIKAEISSIMNNFAEIDKKRKKLLKSMKLDKESKDLIEYTQNMTLWLDERKEWMMKYFYYFFLTIYDLVAKTGDLKIDEILLYSFADIKKFLDKNQKIPEKELNKRRKSIFVLYQKNKPEIVALGKEGRDLFKKIIGKKTGQIKGQVASKDNRQTIEGWVKIIKNVEKDIFKPGEILVTSMTRVEYVPLMRIAKAIITDEGGMACHAAIVSRELGVPSIIGTRNSTQELKDGDRVEMNMKTGEIKLI